MRRSCSRRRQSQGRLGGSSTAAAAVASAMDSTEARYSLSTRWGSNRVWLAGMEVMANHTSIPRPAPANCGRASIQAPRATTGASAQQSSAKPSITGNTRKVMKMPRQAPAEAPRVICNDRRRGLDEDDARAETMPMVMAKVPPLGQAVAIQNTLSSRISRLLRTPATAAATALARGRKFSFHCSRAWWSSSRDAWVWA
ncbi:hypothetical protein D9M68_450550 [compost metagenome]